MLVDQPNVSVNLINALSQKYRETFAPIIATRVNGQRANPVLFSRAMFGELQKLTGDTGGRKLFETHEVVYVDWDDSVLGEADTPEEYARLRGAP
jgi:molybdenum cofactor cytidylyltransferase